MPQESIDLRQPYKVIENIYMVGSSEMSHSMDCCVYVIDAGELVLVDSGAGKSFSRLIDNIRVLGLDPEKLTTVIATHSHIDHIGSLRDFQNKYGAKIIAHKEDADAIQSGKKVGAEYYGVKYIPCKVDIMIDGAKTKMSIGQFEFNFLHIPGHTPGSMAIILNIGNMLVLFGQDIHGPYHASLGGDPSRAPDSLKLLRDIGADILCEGHYGVIRPAEKVKKFIDGFICGFNDKADA